MPIKILQGFSKQLMPGDRAVVVHLNEESWQRMLHDQDNPSYNEALAFAARGEWALSEATATAVRLLVLVYQGTIKRAWEVEGYSARRDRGPGGRSVTRVTFDLIDIAELERLVGEPSPVPPQRNPVATLPALAVLGPHSPDFDAALGTGIAAVGRVRLAVRGGKAYLKLPAGMQLIVDVETAGVTTPEGDPDPDRSRDPTDEPPKTDANAASLVRRLSSRPERLHNPRQGQRSWSKPGQALRRGEGGGASRPLPNKIGSHNGAANAGIGRKEVGH